MFKNVKIFILCLGLIFFIKIPPAQGSEVISLENTGEITLQDTNLSQKKESPKFIRITPENTGVENIFGKTEFKKTFKTGIVKDVALTGGHNFSYYGIRRSNGTSSNLVNNEISLIGIEGHFRDGSYYKITSLPLHYDKGYPKAQNKLFEYYIEKNISEHQSITVGQQRTPNTLNGSASIFRLPTGRRSQIASTYSNICTLGTKISGDWNNFEYQAGIFDSGRFLQNTFEGIPELATRITFKPIKNNEKYGKLKIGGSYSGGKRETSYNVYSGHIYYDYKKSHFDFEYAYANGYNGHYISSNKSDGFYTTFIYKLTPKIEPFCRYDTIDADKSLAGQRNTEYSLGLHYYLKGYKTRLTLSYIHANHESKNDSNKIYTMLEILL